MILRHGVFLQLLFIRRAAKVHAEQLTKETLLLLLFLPLLPPLTVLLLLVFPLRIVNVEALRPAHLRDLRDSGLLLVTRVILLAVGVFFRL